MQYTSIPPVVCTPETAFLHKQSHQILRLQNNIGSLLCEADKKKLQYSRGSWLSLPCSLLRRTTLCLMHSQLPDSQTLFSCLDTVPDLIVSGCSDFQEADERQSQPKVIRRITRRGGKEMNNYAKRWNESIYTL